MAEAADRAADRAVDKAVDRVEVLAERRALLVVPVGPEVQAAVPAAAAVLP